MSARSANVPRFPYLLAMAAGLSCVMILYEPSHLMTGFLESEYALSRAIILTGFALGYAALGAVFGSLWPGATWRWGIWISAPPACVISFIVPGVWFFLGWVGLTLPSACLGAYAACALIPDATGRNDAYDEK
ncbi:MAG TPA: hypothetical protein VFZ44_17200 [Pyrinomonadaceae bacterium]